MATAAVNGTLYALFSTTGTVATASASTDRLYACRSASIKFDAAVEDASSKESGGWWDGMPGQKGVTLDFSGVWDEAGSASAMTAAEIIAHLIGTNVARKFAFVPAALGTTIPGWMGMGIFSGASITADNEKPCEFSGSVKGTGAWSVFTA
jgi:hypothetical protein